MRIIKCHYCIRMILNFCLMFSTAILDDIHYKREVEVTKYDFSMAHHQPSGIFRHRNELINYLNFTLYPSSSPTCCYMQKPTSCFVLGTHVIVRDRCSGQELLPASTAAFSTQGVSLRETITRFHYLPIY